MKMNNKILLGYLVVGMMSVFGQESFAQMANASGAMGVGGAFTLTGGSTQLATGAGQNQFLMHSELARAGFQLGRSVPFLYFLMPGQIVPLVSGGDVAPVSQTALTQDALMVFFALHGQRQFQVEEQALLQRGTIMKVGKPLHVGQSNWEKVSKKISCDELVRNVLEKDNKSGYERHPVNFKDGYYLCPYDGCSGKSLSINGLHYHLKRIHEYSSEITDCRYFARCHTGKHLVRVKQITKRTCVCDKGLK